MIDSSWCKVLAAALCAPLVFVSGFAQQAAPETPAPSTAEPADEAPKPPPKRDDYIAKPGAPRKPLPDVFMTKPRTATEPRDKISTFNNIRTGQAAVDEAVVDAFAKYHVYRMTAQGMENDAVREILNIVLTAKDGRGNPSVDFLRSYKKALVKYVGEILDENGALLQINALFLLTELQDGGVNVPDATPIFLKVVGDPERLDGVVLMALKGLSRSKLRGLIRAEEEQQAVGLILKRLGAGEVQSVLLEEMLATLGTLRRPFQRTPEDALAATAAANSAVNPDLSPRARFEAGRALAQMDVAAVQQWNSKLQARIVARTLQEYLEYSEARRNEGVDLNRLAEQARYEALLWLDALTKGAASGANQADQDFQQFAREIAVEKILAPIVNRQLADVQSLVDWVQAHPIPENHRLAPRAPEVAFPKPPPPGEKEPAGPDSQSAAADRS
jgi:hypothetical protein